MQKFSLEGVSGAFTQLHIASMVVPWVPVTQVNLCSSIEKLTIFYINIRFELGSALKSCSLI